jgi:hypothetical protein
VNAFEAKSLNEDQVNMQAYMKKLLNWRKGSKAVTSGKTLHFAPFNDIYVYFRYVDGEKVMVIMNRNEKTATIDPKRFAEIIGANNKAIDIFSSNVFDLNNLFEVPPKSTLVLEIK